MNEETGAPGARARALALLRIRGWATAAAILPAAVAVVLFVAGSQGHAVGGGWDTARWVVTACAVVVLLLAVAVGTAIVRAKPAVSPTVPLAEEAAPDLYRLVRDLADRLGVPAPSAIALTPDCDSWLEDRTHPSAQSAGAPAARPSASSSATRAEAATATEAEAGTAPFHAPAPLHAPVPPATAPVARPGAEAPRRPGAGRPRRRRVQAAPVLVIGSPFLWWMRVAELRAVLAPVVAGTGPSAHPDIAAARRFVRGLDGVVADAAVPAPGPLAGVRKVPRAFVGRIARLLLRGCRNHAAEMERSVASAASIRAQDVDHGLRIVAQEQVGLAYAGWDRLLTRVALPAWRMGRWPSRLDAGVVSALTELSRRDRLADGFAARLGERPACDLLEEPGAADEAASLLAARLFHGGPARTGADWSPVDWQQYPEEVVDRKWRTEAARLHRVLDSMSTPEAALTSAPAGSVAPGTGGRPFRTACPVDAGVPTLARVVDHLAGRTGGGEALAAGISAALAREEAAAVRQAPSGHAPGASAVTGASGATGPAPDLWGPDPLPFLPLQPPRTGTELLADHVVAMVCCAAVDTAGAAPGLDWLDGPALLVDGERRADLGGPVLSLVEEGDAEPLRSWLASVGVRTDKPVRLV
ncbi:hypothetical protein [Streptomyces sp. ML-6]|uniref:hypothetical protein n=1 Tax=Streptomyces sp. ML-6 TaxID=2982693 RepID=UPI0024BFC55D|nr:hypothetical protein [Streptomyces sp. ML-6]MDK0520970.1 hypothetical protein [Streptomyces sp. ML-6]